jgi:O-antigen/teichoic acid export membrane protein
MGLSQAVFFVVQFLGAVIIARLLSPYEMGIYAIAMAVTGVLSAIQAFGLTAFVVREPEMSRDLMASAFTINAIIALALSAAIAGLSLFGGVFLHEAGVKRVMLVLAVLPLLGIFEFLPSANLEREARFKAIAAIGAGQTLVSQGLAVVMALMGFSYMSLAYGQIGAAVFTVIGYNVVGRKHASLRLRTSEWRRIARFGLHMLAISGVNAISTRAADILLGRIVGLGALGLYGRASNLNNLLWSNIHLVIARVLFVDLAAQARRGGSLRGSYLLIVEVLTALLWPGFAGLAIVAGPFILAVFGRTWVAAARPLVMLALASMVMVSLTLTWELFVVRRETGRQAHIEFMRMGAGLAMFAVGCTFGLTGAAAGRIGEALFAVGLYRPHLDRMTDTRLGDFVPLFSRSALLTVLAIAPAGLVMALHRWSELTPLPILMGSIFLGIILWLFGLYLLKHPLLEEFKKIISAVLSSKRAELDVPLAEPKSF